MHDAVTSGFIPLPKTRRGFMGKTKLGSLGIELGGIWEANH
jgi:hypothetical protein